MENTVTKFRDQQEGESFYDYLDAMSEFLHQKWSPKASSQYRFGEAHVSFGSGRKCDITLRGNMAEGKLTHRSNVFIISYDENGQGEAIHCGPDDSDVWSSPFTVSCDVSGCGGGININLKHR